MGGYVLGVVGVIYLAKLYAQAGYAFRRTPFFALRCTHVGLVLLSVRVPSLGRRGNPKRQSPRLLLVGNHLRRSSPCEKVMVVEIKGMSVWLYFQAASARFQTTSASFFNRLGEIMGPALSAKYQAILRRQVARSACRGECAQVGYAFRRALETCQHFF